MPRRASGCTGTYIPDSWTVDDSYKGYTMSYAADINGWDYDVRTGLIYDSNLYIWFEIDVEKELPLLSNSALELIITDNLEKLDDYIYSLSIVEYNNFNLVIGGNNLDVLMNSEMLDICSEENQFVRYRPELKKNM